LWFFLAVIAAALLQGLVKLHGHLAYLPLYVSIVAVWVAGYLLVKFALAVRARRLWIEDRRARGLRTYEQPRDAISNNELIRRILFLPRQKSN
jgi:uncharacterized integral membrane protein